MTSVSPAPTSTLAPTPGAQNDPLAQLRDLHLPDAVSAWPPALGWWILALLLLAVVGFSVYVLWRRRRDNRYRRLAIAELQQYYQQYAHSEDSVWLLQHLSQLLRRAALVAFPRVQVAALSGADWVQFLADSSDQPEFVDQYGELLSSGLYQPNPSFEPEKVRLLCHHWLRKHNHSTWMKNQRSDKQRNNLSPTSDQQEEHNAQS